MHRSTWISALLVATGLTIAGLASIGQGPLSLRPPRAAVDVWPDWARQAPAPAPAGHS